MGIDTEGPEREILKERAWKRVRDLNRERADVLASDGGKGRPAFYPMQDYLNGIDQQFIKDADIRRQAGILQDMLFRTSTAGKVMPADIYDPQQERAYNGIASRALASEAGFRDLQPDAVFLHDEISRLRAAAILQQQFYGEAALPQLREAFRRSLAAQYIERDLEPPEEVSRLISPDEIDGLRAHRALAHEAYDANVREPQVQRELDPEGKLHQKMARRIAKVRVAEERTGKAGELTEHQKLMKVALDNFVRDYPNPDDLFDNLLNLKDGKLPV